MSMRLRWVVQLGVSSVVLAAMFAVLPVREVVETMRGIEISQWIATLLVFLVGHAVSAAKWQLLADSGAGFRAVLRAHFGGLMANLWLPGVAGGDLVRGALLYRHVSDTTRLALGSLADRVVDTIGLLVIAVVGLLLALRHVAYAGSVLVAIVIGIGVAGVAVFAVMRLHPWLLRRLRPGSRPALVAERIRLSLVALWRQPQRLAMCLALSMAVQIAFIGANIALASAAGVRAPIAAWFFAWPLSKIIATLPISVGGLGVREASLAGFLAPFGASSPAVVATGLVWQSILLAAGVVGAVIVFLSGRVLAHGPDHSRR